MMKDLKTVKERILAGEAFTWPEAYIGTQPEYFKIHSNVIGTPSSVTSEFFLDSRRGNISSFGPKVIKIYEFWFKKKMTHKIHLDQVTFKSDNEHA